MNGQYDTKTADLSGLINKMIELAVKNPEVVTGNNSDSDSILYQNCRDEINKREKYFKKAASILLPERFHLR